MRNTIKNVTMVVPVLMISCQVSDHANMGPLMPQTMMTPKARQKVEARPACPAVHCASLSNRSLNVMLALQARAGQLDTPVSGCLLNPDRPAPQASNSDKLRAFLCAHPKLRPSVTERVELAPT